jgi:putative transposase
VRGKKKHRRKPRTLDSRQGHTVAPNLLKSADAPSAPNQVWVTGITYLETGEGWLYLAAILDVRSLPGRRAGPVPQPSRPHW